jgi:hypothetical protein
MTGIKIWTRPPDPRNLKTIMKGPMGTEGIIADGVTEQEIRISRENQLQPVVSRHIGIINPSGQGR